MNRSPFYAREEALKAEFYDARGWERPQWYGHNLDLVERYELDDRPHEWDSRWWSPIVSAEHLHMRDKVGMVDLSAFQIFEVRGPGVVEYMEKMTVNKCDRPVGSSIYTPVLAENGGFRSDLTVMRLAENHYRIVTGAFDGGRDEYWFTKNLPVDGSVQFTNMSTALCTIGVWGPDAQKMVSKLTDTDLSQDGFRYGKVKDVLIDGIPTTMFRVSYVGESGWEIYAPMQQGLRLWDTLWEAGAEFDVRPVGIGVYGTTGRMEKGYLLMGAELESEYSPVEAGLARKGIKKADFIGKEAYLKAREEGPAAIMCALTIDEHTSAAGIARFPCGGNEPILTLDGERIVDSKGRVSRVTSAGVGPSVRKFILMTYLPPEYAVAGTQLKVMYMNELYPVTVEQSTCLFDPGNERMKS
jgi:glycine cleavage system aminomethyltransferase T